MSSAFVIAAPSSGSGKTSLSLGLLKALKNRAFDSQSFKCGPDYIDTFLHGSITGKTGINLDLFFNSSSEVNDLFHQYARQSDVSIVEGVMGLFDGFNRSEGSTASVAKILNLPIVLVVDAKATAYSIAPLLYGYKHFDTDVKFAGVIFNKVGSEGHYQYLKEAAGDIGIPCLGYLPKHNDFQLPERYLGLNFDELHAVNKTVNKIADQISKTVNLDMLLESTGLTLKENVKNEVCSNDKKKLKIAVSKDEAFTFTYSENIQGLLDIGEVEYFSPLHDRCLPKADFVYLSGGYPEMHLETLSRNQSMINSIKEYAEVGGKMLAECGGMMYLGSQIVDESGAAFSMVGIFDFDTSIKHKKLHLGYRKLLLGNVTIKGHEFHYSEINNKETSETYGSILNVKDKPVDTSLYRKNNCYASYMHMYWGRKSIHNILFKN